MALLTALISDAVATNDGIERAIIKSLLIATVRTLSSTKVRIDFTAPVLINDALSSVASYVFGAGPPGTAGIVSIGVRLPPGQVSPQYVEVETSEHTSGAYSVAISNALRGVSGEVGNPIPKSYFATGGYPVVQVAIATSLTMVEVYFSEAIRDDAAANVVANYQWLDGQLTTLEVLGVEGEVITLRTSEQEPGTLYTLSVPGQIKDLAGNPYGGTSAPMLGFRESVAQVDPRQLSLKMYRFLIEGIREDDQARGNQFLERFLEGAQRIWEQNDRAIRSLADIWSIEKCPDQVLPYLKWIVGWTSVFDYITNELDAATLRRLIAASVPFWKRRGAEDSLPEILRLTTGARTRVWTWFDLRFVLDETSLGEEHQGYDPWLLPLPGAPDYVENTVNLRIVDDGSLNRKLVRNLAKLTRSIGERISINYLAFLDLFGTDGDMSQWTYEAGSYSDSEADRPIVANGSMMVASPYGFSEDDVVVISVPGAASWQNYVCTVRAKGRSIAVEPYRSAAGDKYQIEVGLTVVNLRVWVGGVMTILQSTPIGLVRDPSLFYSVRVELVPEGSETRIRAVLDGNLIASAASALHASGTIGFCGNALYAADRGPLEIDEVEVFFNPLEEDVIGINS